MTNRHRSMHQHPAFTGRVFCPECHRRNIRGFGYIFLILGAVVLLAGGGGAGLGLMLLGLLLLVSSTAVE